MTKELRPAEIGTLAMYSSCTRNMQALLRMAKAESMGDGQLWCLLAYMAGAMRGTGGTGPGEDETWTLFNRIGEMAGREGRTLTREEVLAVLEECRAEHEERRDRP